jgi:hypothetical protein
MSSHCEGRWWGKLSLKAILTGVLESGTGKAGLAEGTCLCPLICDCPQRKHGHYCWVPATDLRQSLMKKEASIVATASHLHHQIHFTYMNCRATQATDSPKVNS